MNNAFKVTVNHLDRDVVRANMASMGLMHLESEPINGKCQMSFEAKEFDVPQVAILLKAKLNKDAFLRIKKEAAN